MLLLERNTEEKSKFNVIDSVPVTIGKKNSESVAKVTLAKMSGKIPKTSF